MLKEKAWEEERERKSSVHLDTFLHASSEWQIVSPSTWSLQPHYEEEEEALSLPHGKAIGAVGMCLNPTWPHTSELEHARFG